MDYASQIREHMPVVCSNGNEFATVDHMDGGSIKLTRDESGQHHWIPLGWVTRVDEHVHLDRSSDRVKQEWSAMPPQTGDAGQAMGGQAQG